MRTFIVALAAGLLFQAGALRAETLYFIHVDHLGTPRLAIGEDGVERWRWDNLEPFGNNPPIETMGTEGYPINLPLRFPGQYADKETGLAYNMARDYDPGIGRYVQSDPIGLQGGINSYAYVQGDPLADVDPNGRVSWKGTFGGGAGGFIGGGGLFLFEVTSKCTCNKVMTISGFAVGGGLYFGLRTPKKAPSGSGGSVEFHDYFDCPQRNAADGLFSNSTASVITGTGSTISTIRLGHLFSEPPDQFPAQGWGWDISEGLLIGVSYHVHVEEHCCGK